MKAYIYTGGRVDTARLAPAPDADLIIAADSGYLTARALGDRIDLLVGDMDSLGETVAREAEAMGVELIRVPAEKDDTDTQLAVHEAVRRGADDIVIIGGVSGRLDHTLSTLSILESLCEHRIHAILTDGRCRVRFLKNDSTLVPAGGFKYLSVIAIDEKVKGVSIEGCKYPLKNATLCRRNQYAVSNEIAGPLAMISVRRGRIYVIESND